MPEFKVKYYAATYSGYRTVTAEDEDDAIAKVRSQIRSQMTLPMYSDGYRVVDQEEVETEED